jgi:molecular chaperone GrpE
MTSTSSGSGDDAPDRPGESQEQSGGSRPEPRGADAAPEPDAESAVSATAPPAASDKPELAPEADPLAELTRERDEYRDALIRLQADFENYKKRMIKQQTDHLERAAELLVDKLLPVLDTADLALAHGGGEDVKQVMGALSNVLEREGLERIDTSGGPFDPTLHDAVAHEPDDTDGGPEVAEVLRAGYRWKGRVLRPAMVKVRG